MLTCVHTTSAFVAACRQRLVMRSLVGVLTTGCLDSKLGLLPLHTNIWGKILNKTYVWINSIHTNKNKLRNRAYFFSIECVYLWPRGERLGELNHLSYWLSLFICIKLKDSEPFRVAPSSRQLSLSLVLPALHWNEWDCVAKCCLKCEQGFFVSSLTQTSPLQPVKRVASEWCTLLSHWHQIYQVVALNPGWHIPRLKEVLWLEVVRTLLLFQTSDRPCVFILKSERALYCHLNLFFFQCTFVFFFFYIRGLGPGIAACSYIY